MTNPEHLPGSSERTSEIQRAAAERSAELSRSSEREHGQEHHDNELENARREAHVEALSAKEHRSGTEDESRAKSPTVASADRTKSYRQTMKNIEREMSVPARVFSRFIHNKTVERVSDAVGSTVARPNAVLSGAICAFLFVLALYVHAKYLGYALRGSETILAFLLGWAVGVTYDLIKNMLRHKR